MDTNEELIRAVKDGIREGVKTKLSAYNSPVDKLIIDVLHTHDGALRSLLGGAIESAIGDMSFREEIKSGVRHTLAKLLVQRFGGEMEKQVNAYLRRCQHTDVESRVIWTSNCHNLGHGSLKRTVHAEKVLNFYKETIKHAQRPAT